MGSPEQNTEEKTTLEHLIFISPAAADAHFLDGIFFADGTSAG
jgi:hypothetical protein